jgi:hypothetical protein
MAMTKSFKSTLIEIGKWTIVLWLMSPLALAMRGPVDFSRVAIGILLFIIFTGKLLFDTIIAPLKTRTERTAAQDVIMMIGAVTAVGLAVTMMIVLIGVYVMKLMGEQNQPPTQ